MAALTVTLYGLKELLKFAGAEVELIWNHKDDLEWMKRELAMIEAVLRDAERRSIQDEAIRLWYAELRDVCYDIQDMMEPFLLQYRQHSQSGILVRFLHNSRTSYALAHEMKTIRKKLNDIKERKNMFNLLEYKVLDWQKINKDRETISSLEPVVLGRDEDQSKIVNLIFDNKNNDQLFVIPILGMGGLGKTTLAKLIFNDKRLKDSNHFDLQEWVYVSTDFKLQDIATCILKKSEHNLKSLEEISQELKSKISGKRILIVLDDVWTISMMDHWEKLTTLLIGSSQGSTIIATTRLEHTAQKIATIDPYALNALSEKTCMQLFKNRAFKSEEMDKYPKLVEIGKDIVKKCGGVALTANALGSMLSRTRDENDWLYVKNSEMMELHNNKSFTLSNSENRILSSLMLSYNLMPPHLKLCFAYCSIFRKGCQIDTNKLAQQWISLNFISHVTNLALEDVAKHYLNDLISWSFLQKCEKHTYGTKQEDRVVLHDLMHDLAHLVAKDHDIKVFTDKENTQCANTTPYRYVSLHGMKNSSMFEIVQQLGKTRAIYLSTRYDITTSEDLFSKSACLRVLEVDGFSSYLPKSLKMPKQLRYFSASHLKKLPKITSLPNLQFLNLSDSTVPESIGNLQSLQYLKMSKCYGPKTLPIANLQNLLHLQLIGCYGLEELPEYFGDLKNLKYLHISSCPNLVALPESITNLQNLLHLKLEGCSNLKQLPQCLGSLRKLEYLHLSYCEKLVSLPNSISKLEKLLHFKLERCWNLKELPESLGNLKSLQYLDLSVCVKLLALLESICTLEKLLHLNLENCSKLKELPESLGILKSLQYLNVSHCSKLVTLPNSIIKLVNLERLVIDSINQVQYLPDLLIHLTCLKHLILSTPHPLSSSSMSEIRRFTNLETLKMNLDFTVKEEEDVEAVREEGVKQCCNIVAFQNLNMLDGKLTIRGLGRVKDPKDAEKANLKDKQKLRGLELIWDGDEDELGDEDVVVAVFRSLQLGWISKLEWLTLAKMAKLRKIDRELLGGNQVELFPSLKKLSLCDMKNLEEVWLIMFPCLEMFRVDNCPWLRSVTPRQPSSITHLRFENFEHLATLPGWIGEFSDLMELEILGCPKIECLPDCIKQHAHIQIIKEEMASNF